MFLFHVVGSFHALGLLGSFMGPLVPHHHAFLSRAFPNAPCISKLHHESDLCVAHGCLSRTSIASPTRRPSPSSRRQSHRVVRVVTLASIAEAPRTVVEEESGFEIGSDQKIFNNRPIQRVKDAKTFKLQRGLVTSITMVVSSLMVNSPAFAGAAMTDEGWVQFWIAWAVAAFLYFLVIPLLLYNYLRLRWYKRKLPEAFLQFGLVFIFFPGLLLLAPFINFRQFPKNNAKEPWDDPRSL